MGRLCCRLQRNRSGLLLNKPLFFLPYLSPFPFCLPPRAAIIPFISSLRIPAAEFLTQNSASLFLFFFSWCCVQSTFDDCMLSSKLGDDPRAAARQLRGRESFPESPGNGGRRGFPESRALPPELGTCLSSVRRRRRLSLQECREGKRV